MAEQQTREDQPNLRPKEGDLERDRLLSVQFRDREEELSLLLPGDQRLPLVNVYGVTGIGKSRLLCQVAQRIRQSDKQMDKRAVVIRVDLADLAAHREQRQQALLQLIVAACPHELRLEGDLDRDAAQIVLQLDRLASDLGSPVLLILDSTDRVQQDVDFWRWAEASLIGPLVTSDHVRIIAAGRVPRPWRRFECREAVRLVPLDRLPDKDAAEGLIAEALQRYNPGLDPALASRAAPLLNSLAYGHPMLCVLLARYAAPRLPEALADRAGFLRELSAEVVSAFARDWVYAGLEALWPQVLQWASVLDRFSSFVLRSYLVRVDEDRFGSRSESFFIRVMTELRTRHALVWWQEGVGNRVHGVLRDILRKNLAVLDPQAYARACRAAAAVYRGMAERVQGGAQEAGYQEMAAEYERRAEQVEEEQG